MKYYILEFTVPKIKYKWRRIIRYGHLHICNFYTGGLVENPNQPQMTFYMTGMHNKTIVNI